MIYLVKSNVGNVSCFSIEYVLSISYVLSLFYFLLQLDSATSLIQAAKNLMNAVVLTVKCSYVASTKYPRQGTIAVSIGLAFKMIHSPPHYYFIFVLILGDFVCIFYIHFYYSPIDLNIYLHKEKF